ncbi:MAG TPA: molybdopterin converting factor subunit 1 [Candidatus Handelsmanbacteria bacterium]|nr:molybdopterin converting factor subunit 1 [Candidatus Handelsmanbacteria bacterium]
MRVEVLFFAGARDAVGARALTISLPEGSTVEALLSHLGGVYPDFAGVGAIAQTAVNEEYAAKNQSLQEGDEVAIIPPVSGGAMEGNFRVVERPIRADELSEIVRSPADGAVLTFSGVVRDHSEGVSTSHLYYEAYAPMAEKKMAKLAQEARTRWPIGDVAMLHRVGRLEIGEISILLSVASPHRAEAFDACRYLIDRLKQEVPIWKKEVGPDGEFWVEGPGEAPANGERVK